MKTLVNGIYQDTLPVSDRGLQYGDGVWETLLIRSSRIILLEEHLERLLLGCKKLKIKGLDLEALRNEISEITSNFSDGILKIIITRGSGGRGYSPAGLHSPSRILSLHSLPSNFESYRKAGIHVQMCETQLSHQPLLAGFKHLNRLEQILAKSEISPENQEGIVCDFQGNIIEGTMSNIFLVIAGEIFTPKLELCGIKGIMQQSVIRYLSSINIEVIEKTIAIQELDRAEGLFFTNSVIGFWPAKKLNQTTFMNKNNKFINDLYQKVLTHIEFLEKQS